MSFLYPLLLAGVSAIALPIIAHMIRNRTRNRVSFSSLMFVPTTMPRFTSRSRIESLPLLIIRCLIICLIAAAFARPFLSRPVAKEPSNPSRRAVVLLDTSASMRREGLWDKAVAQAKAVLNQASTADRVCVMSFDREAATVIGFEDWAAMDREQRVPGTLGRIEGLSPSWKATDLGLALMTAAEAIEEDDTHGEQEVASTAQVVLIGDMQQGSDLGALVAYEWPSTIELVVKALECKDKTNASAQWINDSAELSDTSDDSKPLVRVTNSADATLEQFQLSWLDRQDRTGDPNLMTRVYATPGYSAVARIEGRTEQAGGGRIVLEGDSHEFDNTLYVAPHFRRQFNILYVGDDDPNDSDDMLFYVRRAFAGAAALRPVVTQRRSDETLATSDLEASHMVIVASSLRPGSIAALREYLKSGHTAMLVMSSTEQGPTLAELAGASSPDVREANVDRYAMLSRLDFRHPALMAFADPRFGDFSRIHFWKYRQIDPAAIPDARALAWFDSDDPAWIEAPIGKGSLIVWACGWKPQDSDLALSSKFVPLLYSNLEYGGVPLKQRNQYFVGDHIALPQRHPGSEPLSVRRPDGESVEVGSDETAFAQTDVPGIYTIGSGDQANMFAVNIAAAESQTAPMSLEELENMGVTFESQRPEPTEQALQERQQASLAAMEREQKLWRWLLVAALVALAAEILLAGWLTGRPREPQGEER